MSEIINLNKIRKAKERQKAVDKACQNRAWAGLTKLMLENAKHEKTIAERDLTGKRLKD